MALCTLVLPLPPASAGVTFEERMLQLVNGARAGAGVAPLAVSTTLAGIASDTPYLGCGFPVAGRSTDMGARNYFNHVIANCGGQAAPDMLQAAGVSAKAAENIAWVGGVTDSLVAAERLHNDLMASPIHRANIMNRAFTHVGVGSWATAAGADWSGGGFPLRNVYLTTQLFITQTTTVARSPATHVGVFRPSSGSWYFRTPSPSVVTWGRNGDVPVAGDYNGDGLSDLAVFRPSSNMWDIRTPTAQFVQWGETGDIPVPADYDGNGTADVAVFRPANGTWYLRTATPTAVVWGSRGDVPAPGDYDANGTADVAVFRPGTSSWYIRTPVAQFVVWGETGDKALPLPDAIRRFF